MDAATTDLVFTAIRLMLPWVTSELGRLIHALVTMVETSAIQKHELARFIEIIMEVEEDVDRIAAFPGAPMSGEAKRIMAVERINVEVAREFPNLTIPKELVNAMLELCVIFRRYEQRTKKPE